MDKTFYLHIGLEKTGTSTIQNFLAKNSKLLKANSVYCPKTENDIRNLHLTIYTQDDDNIMILKDGLNYQNQLHFIHFARNLKKIFFPG